MRECIWQNLWSQQVMCEFLRNVSNTMARDCIIYIYLLPTYNHVSVTDLIFYNLVILKWITYIMCTCINTFSCTLLNFQVRAAMDKSVYVNAEKINLIEFIFVHRSFNLKKSSFECICIVSTCLSFKCSWLLWVFKWNLINIPEITFS